MRLFLLCLVVRRRSRVRETITRTSKARREKDSNSTSTSSDRTDTANTSPKRLFRHLHQHRHLTSTVLWLNEKSDDFALYPELEKAFFRNHRKLDVSCIVERDLFGNHLEANRNVQEAAPEFKIGTLSAVAGALILFSLPPH